MVKTVKKTMLFIYFLALSGLCYGESKTFTIGVEELDYMPYYSGVTKKYSGFAKELFDAFGEEYGYTF